MKKFISTLVLSLVLISSTSFADCLQTYKRSISNRHANIACSGFVGLFFPPLWIYSAVEGGRTHKEHKAFHLIQEANVGAGPTLDRLFKHKDIQGMVDDRHHLVELIRFGNKSHMFCPHGVLRYSQIKKMIRIGSLQDEYKRSPLEKDQQDAEE